MRITLMLVGFLFTCAVAAQAEIKGKEMEYTADGTTLRGYIAHNDAMEGKRPGILVVHEWWGLNDYARKRAGMLAELGYTALAVDMYGGGETAAHPENAKKFSAQLRENPEMTRKRFLAGMKALKDHPTVDDEKIAAIGYCFGGGVVLQMARAGVDMDGVVSFHGSIPTDNPPESGEVEARVLVLTGGADPFVTEEQISKFQEQMKAAGADFRVVTYPGAKHSFTNPESDKFGRKFGMPLAYNLDADQQSWKEMKDFFDRIFNGKSD